MTIIAVYKLLRLKGEIFLLFLNRLLLFKDVEKLLEENRLILDQYFIELPSFP